MVGRLTLGQMEQFADHDNRLLSESNQVSFDEAYRELNAELAAKLKPAIDKLAPRVMSPGLTDTMTKLQSMAAAFAKMPKIEMPAVDNLRRIEAQQAQRQAEMIAITDSIAEAQLHEEDRANAQLRPRQRSRSPRPSRSCGRCRKRQSSSRAVRQRQPPRLCVLNRPSSTR